MPRPSSKPLSMMFWERCSTNVFVYLDDILIFSQSYKDHVQHVRQVLSCLLLNNLFVKLEKSEFHSTTVSFLGFILSCGSVQMDPSKVCAVLEWPHPDSLKQVQRFLGFANFYRRFIRGFSSIADPLTALTRRSGTPFQWTEKANQAFERLKQLFTSTPILTLPDPELPFIIEVDASDMGVGAVLSQRATRDNKLHTCAFSRQLTAAEKNYDIGNQELLAVKLALEEWRHWLEGAKHSFVIWTDHKNLTCIQGAKRLNPRQARWALFSNTIRSEVLQWGHAAPSSGHPGVLRTLRRIQSKFWWPNMGTDVRRMVAACSTCAWNKEPRDLPQGKLHPLPIPRQPWSHISMDFVSGLPNSQGNTVILVVVDRFSKACHLIPASKIPTAGQTTELLMQHVFRIHGFPQDIVFKIMRSQK